MKLGMMLGTQKADLYKLALNNERLRRNDVEGQLEYFHRLNQLDKKMKDINVPVEWLDDKPIKIR